MKLLTFSALVLLMLNAVVAFGQTSTTFTANTTFTIPATATSVKIETWGAGGKGGDSYSIYASGGAGGGGYSAQTFSDLAGATLNINFDGNAKVTRTVNATPTNLVLANNGNPGGASTSSADGAGGAGGSTTGAVGTIQYRGGNGEGISFDIGAGYRISGYAGSSAGPGGNGTSGGAAPPDGGGYGGFRISTGSDGFPGGNPGGGGGPAIFGFGGNGGAGKVIITVTDCTPQTYYLDADGDGYYVSTVLACTSPGLGYITTGGTLGDCDDSKPLIWQSASLFIDADGDGYDAGRETVCYGATIPSGYKATTLGTDCNDGNPAVHATGNFYVDADGDTYGAGTLQPVCYSGTGTPAGYSTNNTDCNDGDAAINPGAAEVCDGIDNNCDGQTDEDAPVITYYFDVDGDGYGSPNNPIQSRCFVPTNTVTNNLDCDDQHATVYPGAPELCDGMDNDCDGAVDEDAPLITYYFDVDGDGYGSPGSPVQARCFVPTNTVANNLDCDDQHATVYPGAPELCDGMDNDCDGQIDEDSPLITYYFDVDGDGYGSPGSPIQARCFIPVNTVANNLDCNDQNAAVHPGAVEICGNGIDDNCNGATDENCNVCGNAISFSTTNISSTSVQLNWVANVNPIQWQVQYKTTNQGAKWVDVVLTGDKRSVTISSLKANQNYIWHIRAKCGKNWTAYSMSVSFKTLASAPSSRQFVPAISDSKPMQIFPNPTTGSVNVDLQVEAGTSLTAMISILDLGGRRLYSEKAGLINGSIHRKMQLPRNLAAGTYLVEIIVNDRSYISRLILIK